MWKWTKRGVIGLVLLGGLGVVCFGAGFPSYVKSFGGMMKTAVKDSIPIEFEIKRARDLLEALVPEMHANLKLVAGEEVDVANLEKEIKGQRESVTEASQKLQTLRNLLKTQSISYSISGREYQRSDLVEDLSRRLEQVRTAEMLLTGKQDLLKNRRHSLDAALQKLEKTRLSRIELASQIEALQGQFLLIQAQGSGSEFHIDDSKLAQTQKVISELKKRLEVAQHVLAREARFVDLIPMETVNEGTVVEQVDNYFSKKSAALTAPCVADKAQ